ncbi:hypothetical protein Tco_0085439 [Tanacetum coccineum]
MPRSYKRHDYDSGRGDWKHYLEYIDNEVWKVIQNGNSKKRVTKGKDGVYRVLPPATQEEQFADEKERKARTLLLMAVPKDQLRLFSHVSPKRLGSNQDIVPKLLSLLDALGAGVSDVYYFSPLHLQIASKLATPGLADEVIPFFSTTNADDVDLIHEDLDKIDDLSGWKNSCAFDKRKVEFNYHNTGHLPGSACLGSKEGSRRKSRGIQSNGFADTKASDNSGHARKETEHVKDYILLPLWLLIHHIPKIQRVLMMMVANPPYYHYG